MAGKSSPFLYNGDAGGVKVTGRQDAEREEIRESQKSVRNSGKSEIHGCSEIPGNSVKSGNGKKQRNKERLFCSDGCFEVIILSEKSYKDSEFCQRTDHSGHLRNTGSRIVRPLTFHEHQM